MTQSLAYLPSPDRGVWMLGPVPIRAYALCIIAGILVAVLWGERRFVARGGEPGTVTDVAVFAVPFGLVGGRLYHVLTDWQTYFGPGGNPVDALRIWNGGLGIWGAIALGAVGAWIGCRRRGVPLPFFADAVAPGIVTAQAIGRLGNWFNQELYGGPTTLPWGLEIYRRVDPATGRPDALNGIAVDPTPVAIVHPTFLYELLWNLVVFILLLWVDRRFRIGHGRLFALYVALVGGTGLWAGSILMVGRGFSAAEAAWCTAGFFGAIMVGRIFVGVVVERWGNRRLISLGMILALLGAAMFAYVKSPLPAALVLMVMGAGFAPVYPGLMHEVPRRFAPDAALTVIGRQSGAAYLGMAVLPAGLGWLAQWSLLSIPWVVLGGTALLLIGIRRLDRLT